MMSSCPAEGQTTITDLRPHSDKSGKLIYTETFELFLCLVLVPVDEKACPVSKNHVCIDVVWKFTQGMGEIH